MKYLKKFENFDLEAYTEPEEILDNEMDETEEMGDDSDIFPGDFFPGDGGEEITEGLTAKQKKLPKALQDAILKKQGKSPKKEDKEDKEEDKKKEDKDEKPAKGLTAGQKKLPKALQDAILKKQKK